MKILDHVDDKPRLVNFKGKAERSYEQISTSPGPLVTEIKINSGIDESDRKLIAEGLCDLLADTYTLYLRTQNYHWNVPGSFGEFIRLSSFKEDKSELTAEQMIEELNECQVGKRHGHTNFRKKMGRIETELKKILGQTD